MPTLDLLVYFVLKNHHNSRSSRPGSTRWLTTSNIGFSAMSGNSQGRSRPSSRNETSLHSRRELDSERSHHDRAQLAQEMWDNAHRILQKSAGDGNNSSIESEENSGNVDEEICSFAGDEGEICSFAGDDEEQDPDEEDLEELGGSSEACRDKETCFGESKEEERYPEPS
eukprot:CAMPEP_0116843286 /NCGR_PEP_ID=MMETSP0418-20121206/12002_1 /TAXON_ID=1158023 /ORGANISM="Astrosyne radiata, Strain 13vi08-1A" /LENGTH=169 /DNA_ID=CAMNT_0004474019 /DNA_START=620 /DNA_END=1129 /DNA_ORIENTATION=-